MQRQRQTGRRHCDEGALLELLKLQWEDRYSSTAHGEEINQARQHLGA